MAVGGRGKLPRATRFQLVASRHSRLEAETGGDRRSLMYPVGELVTNTTRARAAAVA